jgi:hypothetical protein
MTDNPEVPQLEALSEKLEDALAARLGIDLSRWHWVEVDGDLEEARDRIMAAEKIPAVLRDRIMLVRRVIVEPIWETDEDGVERLVRRRVVTPTGESL